MILAGASAVSVGTANFHDPGVSAKIVDGIGKYMERQGFESVAEMVGIVRGPDPAPELSASFENRG